MQVHSGYAIAHLPERFQQQPQSKTLSEYIARKYGAYGYRKRKSIEYNPEFDASKVQGYRYVATRYRWVENVSSGLRKVGDASEIIRLDHTGWYTDNWQDETVHGEVYQLPARDGQCQYVPAVNDPNNDDCACLDFRSVTDDKENAARWADSMAEKWAEDEREARAKDDAETRIEEIGSEIRELYQDFRRISREIRANCDKVQGVAVVRELVKEKWVHTKAQIHRLRAERCKIEREGINYGY